MNGRFMHISYFYYIKKDFAKGKAILRNFIEAFPDKVEAYKSGKKGLLGLFMGEVMKRSGGKADPKKTNALLREELEK